MVAVNTPDLWRASFPRPSASDHKYTRGHTAILGSERYTGATRLAAEACSRIGSGLVSVLSQTQADLFRLALPPDIMISERNLSELRAVNTVLAGPGGLTDVQVSQVSDLDPEIALILDADAIRIHDQCIDRPIVFTPHEGEFERYFGLIGSDRVKAVQMAATQSKAIIILKGAETLIGGPDDTVIVNRTASPYLAKAGTGDVLAGFIAGLVAQRMPLFDAACAGVWIHGRASERIGPGLVPQDLFAEIRPVLREILS